MSRHITDHDHRSDAAKRVETFTRIAREDVPKATTRIAQREARDRGANGRLRAFTRIEREEA